MRIRAAIQAASIRRRMAPDRINKPTPTMLPKKWDNSTMDSGNHFSIAASRELTPGVAPESKRITPATNAMIDSRSGMMGDNQPPIFPVNVDRICLRMAVSWPPNRKIARTKGSK